MDALLTGPPAPTRVDVVGAYGLPRLKRPEALVDERGRLPGAREYRWLRFRKAVRLAPAWTPVVYSEPWWRRLRRRRGNAGRAE